MTEIVHKTACNLGKRVDACVAEHGGRFQRFFNNVVSVISLVE